MAIQGKPNPHAGHFMARQDCSECTRVLCILTPLAVGVYLQCIDSALGTLAENGCGSTAAPVPVHRENWTAMITAHIWPPKGKKQLFFSLGCPPLILPFHTSRKIDTRFVQSYKFLFRCDRFHNVDRLEYAAVCGCKNPNQSAIQYKAGIRINSSRPFCAARPFVIHIYGGGGSFDGG